MMKKLLALGTALVLALAMLAGCSGGPSASQGAAGGSSQPTPAGETVTLRFWGGVPPESGPADVVAQFNEAYRDKGIQVEYERYVNDDQGNLKLETSLLAGNEIDVYVSYGTERMQKRVEAGMALDLSDLIQKDNFDYVGQFGQAVKDFDIDGKTYSIATVTTKSCILLNKDMFDAAGIEIPVQWTYDEFREICKQLTSGEGQDKVYGMFWNTQQNISEYWLYLSKQVLGGNPLYKEGGTETNLDNEYVQTAAQLVYNTMQDGSAPTHVDSVTQQLTQEGMFLSGRSAMTVGSWIIRNVKNTEEYPHDFVTAYAPYPVPSAGEANYVYGTPGDLVMVNPKSNNTEAAWEFVKWYATEGILAMTAHGRIPLCNTIDPELIADQFFTGAEDLIDRESAMRNGFASPDDKLTVTTMSDHLSEITAVLDEETEAYFTGKKTLEEAFANAKERADKFLAG